jgi:hypothetical protein
VYNLEVASHARHDEGGGPGVRLGFVHLPGGQQRGIARGSSGRGGERESAAC